MATPMIVFKQAIDAGIDPRVILDDGLFPGF